MRKFALWVPAGVSVAAAEYSRLSKWTDAQNESEIEGRTEVVK